MLTGVRRPSLFWVAPFPRHRVLNCMMKPACKQANSLYASIFLSSFFSFLGHISFSLFSYTSLFSKELGNHWNQTHDLSYHSAQ